MLTHVYVLIQLNSAVFYDSTQGFKAYVCLTITNSHSREFWVYYPVHRAGPWRRNSRWSSVWINTIFEGPVLSFASLSVGIRLLNSVCLNCVNHSGYKWVCRMWRCVTPSNMVGLCKSRIQQRCEVHQKTKPASLENPPRSHLRDCLNSCILLLFIPWSIK